MSDKKVTCGWGCAKVCYECSINPPTPPKDKPKSICEWGCATKCYECRHKK